ncbi:MAG TPA: hypothetical protein VGH90_01105 [Chthoniobacteraceae bacterium]
MPTPAEAEEHLRVIRTLMERATTYRAISAPGALVGGLLAVAGWFFFADWFVGSDAPDAPWVAERQSFHFVCLWMAVLGVTGTVNFIFLWRDAQKRGAPFFSPGMRLAALAVLPSYVVAGFFTLVLGLTGYGDELVPIWLLCHGLGLLATSHFAPRSFFWLGWAFLLTGLVATRIFFSPHPWSLFFVAQQWMAGTFGVYHLIFAACTWPRKQASPEPAFES